MEASSSMNKAPAASEACRSWQRNIIILISGVKTPLTRNSFSLWAGNTRYIRGNALHAFHPAESSFLESFLYFLAAKSTKNSGGPRRRPLCVWACLGSALLASYSTGAKGAVSAHQGGASFAPADDGRQRRNRGNFHCIATTAYGRILRLLFYVIMNGTSTIPTHMRGGPAPQSEPLMLPGTGGKTK